MKSMLADFLRDVRVKTNLYSALVVSMAIAMALYSVTRLVFYLLNSDFFPGMTLNRFGTIALGGLRFDLTAVLYSNSLLLLLLLLPFKFRFHAAYRKVVIFLFVSINALALAMNLADTLYYPFTLRRTTLSVLDQFRNEQNGWSLLFQFLIDYWYGVVIWIVLVAVLVRASRFIYWEGPQQKNNYNFYLGSILMFPIVIYLFIGGARGGFAHSTRPITLSNAAQYATDPKDINLVLNTPFAVMRTATASVIKKANYFADDRALAAVFDPVHQANDTVAFKPKNVVVIILESFSKEFVGAYHQQWQPDGFQSYTPFLDSLIGKSAAFQYSLANGRKSIDAMPSVIASVPSIEVPYVLSHFSGNKINSLPNLLKPKGYTSAFFHGAPNGSMGFQAFANLCGFDRYVGKDEYNNDADYDGIWGIWDDPFLQFFAKEMSAMKEPFYTTLFTVSSHHPYNLPNGAAAQFKGGSKPIHRTIEYTDFALRRFFSAASKSSWFHNTLFVITADHASAEIGYPEYNTPWGYFSIPVFFYDPSQPVGTFSNEVIQQVDIMPTVLSYLHYDQPYVAFGRNVLDQDSQPFAFNYLDNLYQYFEGEYLLRFDGSKTVGLFNYVTDKLLRQNLLALEPHRVQLMEAKVKAFIQQYNNRMVDDNLTVEGPQSPNARK